MAVTGVVETGRTRQDESREGLEEIRSEKA
jgi:hypothetical protein